MARYLVTQTWYENVACTHEQEVEANSFDEAKELALKLNKWSEPGCDTTGDGEGDNETCVINLETDDEKSYDE